MEPLFVSRKMLKAFLFLFIIQISSVTSASLETGVAWLKSQQNPDGSFASANSQATSFQATLEALVCLQQLTSLDSAMAQLGREYLQAAAGEQLEDLAGLQRLANANPNHFSAPTAQLSAYKAVSGGYGDYPNRHTRQYQHK